MYGWTPKEIAQMTLAQQEMYLKDDGDGKTKTCATVGEARAFIESLKAGG